MQKILKNKKVEQLAENRLVEYEKIKGKCANPPIPVDKIIESCNLKILYDKIDEKPGENILGALNTKEGVIVINESHMKLFEEKPGLERYTKAHELGHWDIYVNKDNKTGGLFIDSDEYDSATVCRNSGAGKLSVLQNIWTDNDVYKVFKSHMKRKDHPYISSAVDRYASYLLMPHDLLMEYALKTNLLKWRNLYELAETFGVTISAMKVRLIREKLIYVKENEKKIYRSKDESQGQEMLGI